MALGCTPDNIVSVNTGAGLLRLEVVSPEIVRVSAVPSGTLDARESLVVVPQDGCTEYKFDGSTLTTRETTGKAFSWATVENCLM